MEIVPDTFPSLFWGYTVMWLCILIYIVSLARRMSRIERELREQSKDSSL